MRPSTTRIFTCLLFALLTSGCTSKSLYDWQSYESSLQAHQIAHDEARARAELEASITALQTSGGRVPPGLFAEYGFQQFRSGNRAAAVESFKKEAALFPESAPLMTTLIERIEKQDAAAGAAKPAENTDEDATK